MFVFVQVEHSGQYLSSQQIILLRVLEDRQGSLEKLPIEAGVVRQHLQQVCFHDLLLEGFGLGLDILHDLFHLV